jgi:hypothetical protein
VCAVIIQPSCRTRDAAARTGDRENAEDRRGRLGHLGLAPALALGPLADVLGPALPVGAVPIDLRPRTDGQTGVSVAPALEEPFTQLRAGPVGGSTAMTIGSGQDFLQGAGARAPGGYDVGGTLVVYDQGSRVHPRNLAIPGSDRAVVTGGGPTTDGRYVFWQVTGSGQGFGLDIHGYDTLTEGEVNPPTFLDENVEPDSRGGVLAWVSETGMVTATPIRDFLPGAPRPDPNTTNPY